MACVAAGGYGIDVLREYRYVYFVCDSADVHELRGDGYANIGFEADLLGNFCELYGVFASRLGIGLKVDED